MGLLGPIGLLGLVLCAAEPSVRSLDLRGLRSGGITSLVIDGEDLGAAPRLLLPFAAKATLKPGSTPKRALFDVALDASVPAGFCNLRVATEGGVSLPLAIAVDSLPQRGFAAEAGTLPVALHGAASGSTVASTKFSGKAGQKIMVEVEAQRLGSLLRPILHLYDAKKKQLAWAWGKPSLGGDARLVATLPADGEYSVSIHDAEYSSANPSHFRLKLGLWSFVEQVFPPVVAKGRKTVAVLGSDGAAQAEVSPTGVVAWPKAGGWSGPRPFVAVSEHAELEAKNDGKPQPLPEGPVGVSGTLKEGAADTFRVPVKPGSKVRLEVFAERLKSSLHAALTVRNEAGAQLARSEEGTATVDPLLDYTVPAGTMAILVNVSASQGSGVYRLAVDPGGERADFRLAAKAQRITLPADGRFVLPVLLDRRGYAGPVELVPTSLPVGTRVEGASISAGADGTLVTVQRGAAAFDPSITRWVGRGDKLERPVVVAGDPLARVQPWAAEEIAVASSSARAADFAIDWGALPADVGLVPARKLSLPIKVSRPSGNTFVRLTLLTSQNPPLANNQPDLNRTIRIERATEFAPKTEAGAVPVLVPPELPSSHYDVTVQAELLAADRRTVLATAFAPVRRLAVKMPLVVKLETPARLTVTTNPKMAATLDVKGKVERREGLASDVTLTVAPLPPGVPGVNVSVKAGTDAFAFKLAVPRTLAPGEYRMKLSGIAVADPKQPGVRVKSRDVELVLAVLPAAK